MKDFIYAMDATIPDVLAILGDQNQCEELAKELKGFFSPILLFLSNPLPRGQHRPVSPPTPGREVHDSTPLHPRSPPLRALSPSPACLPQALTGPYSPYAAAGFDLASLNTVALAILDRGGLQWPYYDEWQVAHRRSNEIVCTLPGGALLQGRSLRVCPDRSLRNNPTGPPTIQLYRRLQTEFSRGSRPPTRRVAANTIPRAHTGNGISRGRCQQGGQRRCH